MSGDGAVWDLQHELGVVAAERDAALDLLERIPLSIFDEMSPAFGHDVRQCLLRNGRPDPWGGRNAP